MKKVLIDVNSAVIRSGSNYLSGIGRTTLDLVAALAEKQQLPFKLQLYFQNIRGNTNALDQLNCSKLNIRLPGAEKYKNLVTKLRIKEFVSGYDVLHIPHNFDLVANPKKTIITLHDAMFFSYPEDFLGHEYARQHYPPLIKSCKAIVTCSEASKSDIVHYMNVLPENVTVIPWAVSNDFFYPESRNVIQNYLKVLKLDCPYFIMVSCDIGRKNTISLLKAYRLFLQSKPQHNLVLVWNNPPDEILNEFSTEIIKGRVKFLNGVSDKELGLLYNGATASFFPSKYEGFGLPLIESMACGTPVVTCKNSSLIEVGGDVALYTESEDIEEMADYMRKFEDGSFDLSKLGEESINQANKFSWSKSADDYIRFYQENL